MPGYYASFGIDRSLNFELHTLDTHSPLASPTFSNFSRPISLRPMVSKNASTTSLALPELSRPSSFGSLLSGPLTPVQLAVTQKPQAEPIVASSRFDFQLESSESSFMHNASITPDLDLSFSFHPTVTRTKTASSECPLPSSLLLKSLSQRSREEKEEIGPSCKTLDVEAALTHKHLSLKDSNQNVPHSTFPTTTSFSAFRQSLAERQAEVSRISPPQSPAFLQKDPFASRPQSQQRPSTAGGYGLQDSKSPDDFVFDRATSTKKYAPSMISTRSTRSIRKGLSRVKRLLKGPLA